MKSKSKSNRNETNFICLAYLAVAATTKGAKRKTTAKGMPQTKGIKQFRFNAKDNMRLDMAKDILIQYILDTICIRVRYSYSEMEAESPINVQISSRLQG